MTVIDEMGTPTGESTLPAPADRRDIYLVRSFTAHLAQYIGIGLISGSVVHASTLGGSSLKYGALIGLGMLIYCMKYIIESRFRLDRHLLRFLGVSTIVSLGTGMLSGSAQHFVDGPYAGAILASAGVVVAYIAFCIREDRRALTRRSVAAVLALGGTLFAILWVVAGLLGGSDHGGGH